MAGTESGGNSTQQSFPIYIMPSSYPSVKQVPLLGISNKKNQPTFLQSFSKQIKPAPHIEKGKPKTKKTFVTSHKPYPRNPENKCFPLPAQPSPASHFSCFGGKFAIGLSNRVGGTRVVDELPTFWGEEEEEEEEVTRVDDK